MPNTLTQNAQIIDEAVADIKDEIALKGVTVPDPCPITTIPSLIESISGGGGEQDTQQLINMIERPQNTEIVIPEGTTAINAYAFYSFSTLINILFPTGLTYIGAYAFYGCRYLVKLTLPSSLTAIGQNAFQDCRSLKELTLPSSLTSIGRNAFRECKSLEELTLPSSLTSINEGVFIDCRFLEFVTIENGFNCNYLDLSASILYSHDTILSWFNALADRTGQTAYTLTIGTTNLNKMTAEEKAIAINKNWNLA